MIQGIAKLIVALNSNQAKGEIAAGFAWGVLFGLIPAGNAFWILFFVLSFFLRHNQGGKILALALVKIIMPLLAPLSDELGWFILNAPPLYATFTELYNSPFVLFTNFNNTLVAGGVALGIVLWFPVFILFCRLIPIYRSSQLPKVLNTTLAKISGKIPFAGKIKKAFDYYNALTED